MKKEGPSKSVKKRRKPVPRHLPGHIAGRYRILSLLGRGAAGEVVEGYDLLDDRLVAIKILKRDCARDPNILGRFLREATAMGRIDHPGIVRIHDTGMDKSGLHYLVMEIVVGQSLREVLEECGRLPPREVARIAAEVCEVMHVAHEMDIFHRDLKPSNLLVPEDWSQGGNHIRVVDFGTAKIAAPSTDQHAKKLTSRGDMIGTPPYMSPEQASGKVIDARSDLYSLGCLMYQCLSGHLPFDGPNHFSIILGHLERDPVPLNELMTSAEVPLEFAAFVGDLIAKDPADRPINAAAAEATLRQMIERLPSTVTRRQVLSPLEYRDKHTGLPLGGQGLEKQVVSGVAPSLDFSDDEVTEISQGDDAALEVTAEDVEEEEEGHLVEESQDEGGDVEERHVQSDTELVPQAEPAPEVQDETLESPFQHQSEPQESPLRKIGRPMLGLLGLLVFLALGVGALFVGYAAFASFGTESSEEAAISIASDEADPEPSPQEAPEAVIQDEPPITLRNIQIHTEPPDAQIFRGASRLGMSPISIGLEEDEHLPAVFIVLKDGFQAEYLVVTEEHFSSQGHRVDKTLKPIQRGMSRLEILTEKSGAEVQENGKYIGLTPVNLARPISQQVIRLRILEGDGEGRLVVLALTDEDLIIKVSNDERIDPVPEVRQPFRKPTKK